MIKYCEMHAPDLSITNGHQSSSLVDDASVTLVAQIINKSIYSKSKAPFNLKKTLPSIKLVLN